MQTFLLIFGLLLSGGTRLNNADDSDEFEGIPHSHLYQLLRSIGALAPPHIPVSHYIAPGNSVATYFNQPSVQEIRYTNQYAPQYPQYSYPAVQSINPNLYNINPQTMVMSPLGIFYNPDQFPGYFTPILPNHNLPGFDRGDDDDDSSYTELDCMRYGRLGSCNYDDSECEERGGKSHQYCADVTKQCCLFYHKKCDIVTQGKTVHIENVAHPLSTRYDDTCKYTIKKSSKNICGFRFKFDRVAMSGNCHHISFTVVGESNVSLEPICGALTGKQYDVLANSVQEVVFSLKVDKPKFVSYKITVQQLKCDEPPQILWPLASSTQIQDVPVSIPKPEKSPSNGKKPTEIVASEMEKPEEIEPKPTEVVASEMEKPEEIESKPEEVVASEMEKPEKIEPKPEEVVEPKPQTDEETKDDGSNPSLLSCGFSTQFHSIPKTSSTDELRAQESLEADDEPCDGEAGSNDLLRNPLLTSDVWDVPTVNQSQLYEAAGTFLPLDGRVTFGKKTKQFEHPWQIVMYINGRFHCSGSIISRRDILTAAHCVNRYKFNPSILKITIGDYDIKSITDGPNIVGVAQKIIVHEKYSARKLQNDIAIIRLRDRLTFSHRVSPVCLPSSDLKIDGQLVTVTGWGRDEKNHLQSVLMKHTAAVLTNQLCNNRWKSRNRGKNLIVDSMLCMDPQLGDSCKGDSGGPCVIEYPEGSKKYTQVGLVSFGSATCTDKKLPGVYTRVGYMLPWIKKHMKS